MKKIFLSLGICFLAFSTSTFAEEISSPQDFAKEISVAIERTANANFSADTDLQFSGKGTLEDIIFDVSYDSGIVKVVKAKNAFSVISTDEKFSAKVESIPGKKRNELDFLFPFNVSSRYAGEFLADIDAMKFSGKFNYKYINIENNLRLQNVIKGIQELVEPISNKWIELDLGKMEKEFPEILNNLEEEREEILAEFSNEFSGKDLEDLLLEAIKSENIQMVKTQTQLGDEYVIRVTNPSFFLIKEIDAPVVRLTIYRGVITKISLSGGVENFPAPKPVSGKIYFSANISYGNTVLQWPNIQKSDWELTKVVRMAMEFIQEEKNIRREKNAIWYNLENDLKEIPVLEAEKKLIDATTNDEELKKALSLLLTSDFEKAVRSYLVRYSDLNERLKANDIFFIARQKELYLSNWEKGSIRDVFFLLENEYGNNLGLYDGKIRAGWVLKLVDEYYFYYQPYNVEIDEEKIYKLETKADFLILLARGVQAFAK